MATLVEKEMAEPWIIWADTNYEADALKATMPWVDEVRGSDKTERKEEVLEAFATGQIKHLIGKPSMCERSGRKKTTRRIMEHKVCRNFGRNPKFVRVHLDNDTWEKL